MAELNQEQLERLYNAALEQEKHKTTLSHHLTTEQSYRKELGDYVAVACKNNIPLKEVATRQIDTDVATRLHQQGRPREEIRQTLEKNSPQAAEYPSRQARQLYAAVVERDAHRNHTQEQNLRPERSRYQTATTPTPELSKREMDQLQQMRAYQERER